MTNHDPTMPEVVEQRGECRYCHMRRSEAPTINAADALRFALATVMRYPNIRQHIGNEIADLADEALAKAAA